MNCLIALLRFDDFRTDNELLLDDQDRGVIIMQT
jgi:hypothetical protein